MARLNIPFLLLALACVSHASACDSKGHDHAAEESGHDPHEHADDEPKTQSSPATPKHSADERGEHERHGDDHGNDDHREHGGTEDHEEDPHDEHGDHGDEDHEGEESVVQLDEKASARVKIRTAAVQQRAVASVLSTTGRVDFDQDRLAHVSPRLRGRVSKVRASLGDKIRAGQSLAVLDSMQLGQAKSEFLRAKSQLQLATKTRERELALRDDKITSEQSVIEAESAYQTARANFQSARQQLRLMGLSPKQIASVDFDDPSAALFPLSSPIAGTIVEKHVTLGEVVTPERSLFTIADLRHLWIWIDVYERDLGRVHLEDDVIVKVEAFPGRTFEGKVAYIRDEVDPDARTARARIDVENTDGRLRAGMFAQVTLTDPHGTHGQQAGETLVVPTSAIQRDGKSHVVFVSRGERRYERRVVALGTRTATLTEVLEGVTAGEQVVVEGTFVLKSEAAKHAMGGGHSH